MLEIKENFSLKKYNTFGFDVKCLYFSAFYNEEDLKELIQFSKKSNIPLMVLGGGSNILFTKDFKGLIIHPVIRGIEILNDTDDFVYLRVGAGENWDSFVEFCVNNNWGGIENLSLIPGFVGTCPIQNIGAYGVEVKDVILKVESVEIDSLIKHEYLNSDCEFGYRDSIFKRDLKGNEIITYVQFILSKKHVYRIDYGNLKDELQKYNAINIKNIRQAVVDIRNSKLPNPEEIGNAGSFFKNPEIELKVLEKIKENFPNVPYFPLEENKFKIPAGWLIEQAGWKGKNIGNAGVHSKQALVLVNLGGATGAEVLNLALEIRKSINKQFGIELEMEVNII